MFKSLYIMDDNGIVLYSKNFMEKQYDDNILIGFFASIANFSREALGSVIKNIDLGQNNKLILLPILEEKILGAAIVSSNDNNQLIINILKDILQDFVDIFAPDYDPEKIFEQEMQKIIDDNMKGKIMQSPKIRFLLSWIIVAPLSYFLIFISIYATTFIYTVFRIERFLESYSQLLTRFMPSLILISTINIIILFLLPNLILGYLSPNWKIAVVNSLIYLGYTIALYFYSIEPNFAYILVGYLPLALIFSLFFLFIGIRYSSKKFLKK